VAELRQLSAQHAAAVLAFERTNREFFAGSITDRGDDWFEHFAERHDAQLADQEAGTGAFYVLLAPDGSVLGRFNLYAIAGGTADLGYRVAESATRRGLATAAVGELCLVASIRYDLHTLRAATADANTASRSVLLRNGFAPAGPADPSEIGGKRGTRYRRDL
jgi:ribosomal-protein-alanine N-acetyltransferase